jgi:hypothetical protein
MSLKQLAMVIGIAAVGYSGLALAQQESAMVLPGVSPIPSDAHQKFCYYAGQAYSPNSYLAVSVPTRAPAATTTVTGTQTGAAVETTLGQTILLQCVTAEAAARDECPGGGMAWAVRQSVAVSPR